MLLLRTLVCLSLMLALLESCSDLGTREQGAGGTGGSTGLGGGGDNGLDPPEPKSRPIDLGCRESLSGTSRSLTWELEVVSSVILAGDPFAADFEAIAGFTEPFLDNAQFEIEGGFDRVELVDLRATVHIRRGATDRDGNPPPDVVLLHAPLPRTCRYDDNGLTGVGVGPFPSCDEEGDLEDGSNADCTGLGGVPSPDNPCREHVTLFVSPDCEPGGRCEQLDGGSGRKTGQCELNGFCVTDPLEVPLTGSSEPYRAASSGSVFFGFDDQSTGATVQEGGPNDGMYNLPLAVFDDLPGPNSIRARIGELEIAVECTMAVNSFAADGAGTRDFGRSRTPDYKLIHLPIQRR